MSKRNLTPEKEHVKTQTPSPAMKRPITAAGRLGSVRASGTFPLLVVLALGGTAQAQFDCTTINGAITITGYAGPGGAVTIPGTIEGQPVTGIGELAFVRCASVTSVAIPESITSVKVPSSVTSIGFQAFAYCGSLAAIAVDGLNPIYSSLDGVLFDKNRTMLIQRHPSQCGYQHWRPGLRKLREPGGSLFQGQRAQPWWSGCVFRLRWGDPLSPARSHRLGHDVWRSPSGAVGDPALHSSLTRNADR